MLITALNWDLRSITFYWDELQDKLKLETKISAYLHMLHFLSLFVLCFVLLL